MNIKCKLRFLYLLLFSLFAINATAQSLTAEEKRALETRVKNKVDEYQFYLNQLGDKRSTSETVKNNAVRLALKLFIGEGENYTVDGNTHGAVRMEISSKYRSAKSRIMQKRYLNNLRNNRSYDQIEITDADVVRVDGIQREGDHYVCMAYFCQKFIGFRDRRAVYSDITTKKVKVYVQAIEVPRTDGSTQIIWNALLGDIYVVSTKPVR